MRFVFSSVQYVRSFALASLVLALAMSLGCNQSSDKTARNSTSDAADADLEPPSIGDADDTPSSTAVREPRGSKPPQRSRYASDEETSDVESPRMTSGRGAKSTAASDDDEAAGEEAVSDEVELMSEMQALATKAAGLQQGKVTRASLPRLRALHRQRIEVADKILALPNPTAEAIQTAYTVQLDSYDNLVALEDEDAAAEFRDLCLRLAKHPDTALSRVGRIMTLQFQLQEWLQSKSEDGQPMAESTKSVLETTEVDPQLIQTCAQIAANLVESRAHDAAATVYAAISSATAKSEDPRLRAESAAAGLQAKLVRERVSELALELATAEEPNPTVLAEKLDTVLTDVEPGPASFSVLSNLAQRWEMENQVVASGMLYDRLDKLFAGVEDKQIADRLKMTVGGARKRLSLVGHPLAISGKLAGGGAFDWEDYKGKVVLLDFWATWCGPCLEEMNNIAQVHQKYKSQGFEVIGVNLDQKPDDLTAFLKQNAIPWSIVVDKDNANVGFKNPLAQQCGVTSIPFVVLIDKDGVVAAIHTRGEKLEPAVQALLGVEAKSVSDSRLKAPETVDDPEIADSDARPVGPIDDESTAKATVADSSETGSSETDSSDAGASDDGRNPLRTGRKTEKGKLRP